jgi:hypothetical protein
MIVASHGSSRRPLGWVPQHDDDRVRDVGGVLTENPDKDRWVLADQKEDEMFRKMGTYRTTDVCDLPDGAVLQQITTHREYKIKGGDFVPKTRRCIRGDREKFGRDFFQTTAPTPKLNSFKYFCSLVASSDMHVEAIDFNAAHLQGPAEEGMPCYVKLPRYDPDHGAVGRDGLPCVGLLTGNFYGKKNAARIFFHMEERFFGERGAIKLASEPCWWMLVTDDGFVMYFFHADDMLVASPDEALAKKECDMVTQVFSATSSGSYDAVGRMEIEFIGFNVVFQKAVGEASAYVHIGAATQIKHLLLATGFDGANGSSTPFMRGYKLLRGDDEVARDESVFALCAPRIVGCCVYLHEVRPDISGQLHALQKKAGTGFNSLDTGLMKHMLRYLKQTPTRGCLYRGVQPPHVLNKPSVYVDANFDPSGGGNSNEAYMIILNGGPVAHGMAKTPNDCSSAPAAELLALATGSREARAARSLCAEVGIPQPGPTSVYEDNQAVITQTKSEQGPGKKARQWVARANTIKTCRDRGEIVVKKIPGDSNPADLGTKPVLPTAQYERLVGMCMGLPDGRMVGGTALAGAHVVDAGAGAGLEAGVT